jgi:hypothetical protein
MGHGVEFKAFTQVFPGYRSALVLHWARIAWPRSDVKTLTLAVTKLTRKCPSAVCRGTAAPPATLRCTSP